MDHHGFLGLVRQIDKSLSQATIERDTSAPRWWWNCVAVINPESKCPFCHDTIRSDGIWFFAGERYKRIVGLVMPNSKFILIHPSHPHDTGGGFLCLGRNPDGIALLASAPNLMDCPLGPYRVPRWLKRYWGHTCNEAKDYLFINGHIDWLQELEEP
jgi:hypothetical protein